MVMTIEPETYVKRNYRKLLRHQQLKSENVSITGKR